MQMPTEQGVLSSLWTQRHVPSAGLHDPSSHSPTEEHTTGLPPVHMPAWHVSPWVQASPSLQTGPVSSAHVPSVAAPAAIEHPSQGPALQAVSQQTPSTQKPLPQSLGCTHATATGI